MKTIISIFLCLVSVITLLFNPIKNCMTQTPNKTFNESFYTHNLTTANDPWITKGDDNMYYYCYSSGGLKITRSKSLSDIYSATLDENDVKTVPCLDSQTERWAPELHEIDGLWYLFYAASFGNENRLHRMYVAKSKTNDPFGEWNEPQKMNLPDDEWAIDGTVFEYNDGRLFFVWSGWENENEGIKTDRQRLYIVELDRNNPARVISQTRTEISNASLDWETSVKPILEGPSVICSPNGMYYLLYSANFSLSDEYAEGVMKLDGDPLKKSSWTKFDTPLLQSDSDVGIFAPGHACVVKSPDETEDWIIYHAAKKSGSAWNRTGYMQKLEWRDDKPFVDMKKSIDSLPSGEIADRTIIQLEDGKLSFDMKVGKNNDGSTVVSSTGKYNLVRLNFNAPETAEYTMMFFTSGGIKDDSEMGLSVRVGLGKKTTIYTSLGSSKAFVPSYLNLKLNKGMNQITISLSPGLKADFVIIQKKQ